MPASARLPVSSYWIPPSRRLSAMHTHGTSTGTTSSGGSGGSSDSVARNYVDPWDLENYAYLRRHCADLEDSDPVISLSTNGLDSAHSDFYFVPARQPLTPLPTAQRSARRASIMEDASALVEEEDFYNARCEMRSPACCQHQKLRRASIAPAAIPAELQEKARPRQLAHGQGRGPPPPPLVYVYQTPRPSRKMSTHISEFMPPMSTSGSGEDTDEMYDELLSMARRRRPHHHHHHHNYHQNHNHFGLNTLGHLKIDYSCNWSNLDRYIAHT